MERHLFLIWCLHLSLLCYPQSDLQNPGAAAAALGNTSSLNAGPESIYGNLSGLSDTKTKTFLTSYYLPFGIAPLSISAASFIYPLKNAAAGIFISRYGNKLYNEQTVNSAFAHKIDRYSLGLGLNLKQYSFSELGKRMVFICHLGGQAKISEEVVFAASIYNLNLARLSKSENIFVPVIMQAGFQYRPVQSVIINLETEKDLSNTPILKAGLQFDLGKSIQIRSGFSNLPSKVHLGLGIKIKSFDFNYAVISHPHLGNSHAFTLQLHLSNK